MTDATHETWTIVRAESTAMLGIAVPMFLFVVLEIVFNVIMAMMVGFTDKDRSTQILAGFSLENAIETLLVNGMLGGFVAGVNTLCTQAFGGKRFVEMWLFAQAGLLGYLATLPFVLLILIFGSSILESFGQDPVITAIAGNVLMATAVGYPIGVVMSLIRGVLHAQNVVMPFVVTSLIAWPVTLAFTYYLAFHTSFGYMSFAIATPLSWLIKTVMLTPVLLRNQVFVQFWPGWQFHQALQVLPSVAKLGSAGLLMTVFQSLGLSILAMTAGLLPNADIAITVNGIFGMVVTLSCLPFSALITAGAIRIGNSLGAGKARRAQIVCRITIISSLAVSLLQVVSVPFCADSLAKASTPNQTAIDDATKLIMQLLPIIPLFSLALALQAVFSACGRQLLCAVINFICSFVIGVPVSVLFGFTWGFDLVGLWYGTELGLVLTIGSGFGWLALSSWTQLAHEAEHNVRLQDPSAAAAA